jgi:endonuclease YncB( thermonuclease family)
MPFILIQGTYHLVNRNPKTGKESGFEPDGDSIHFKPANPDLLKRLAQPGRPYKLSNIGSLMLRLEGIDALELHYSPDAGGASSHQPRPLADNARNFLTGQLGLNPVPYAPPRNVRVKPPVERDATPGFILSRALEINGRPVSFAFAGKPPAEDGAEATLTTSLLKRSLNYKLVQNGHAYPLFYEGLFADLRNAMATAAGQARKNKRGLWPLDKSQTGLVVNGQADLETGGALYPKLFRRLTDYLAEKNGPLAGFPAWLAAKWELVLDLRALNFTHFDNLIKVQGNKVKMMRRPEEMVFVSQK